jgi:hypothetical protein
MLVPKRFAHYVYGVTQAGITSAIASAISYPWRLAGSGETLGWLHAWLAAWVLIVPIVICIAPGIHWFVRQVTARE